MNAIVATLSSSLSIPNLGVSPRIAQAKSIPVVTLFDLHPSKELANTTALDSAQETHSPFLGKLQTWYGTQVQHLMPPSFA